MLDCDVVTFPKTVIRLSSQERASYDATPLDLKKDDPPSTRLKGRKPKLTRALIERSCELLRAGNYIETVAEKLGIGTTTFFRWQSEAETRGGLFRDFRDAVAQASADAESDALASILGPKTPENLKWFLERRFPDRWARRERVEETKIDPFKHPHLIPPAIINFIVNGEPFVPPIFAAEPGD